MNEDLGLKILSEIMAWDDEQARREFAWLRLMSRLKYDGYRDFQAGMRFIESLATWLQQFEKIERPTAYSFVRDVLVYVGPNEMNRLVEQLYPAAVREQIVGMVARERSIPRYRVLADDQARAAVERLRKQTLFMGLSDGAHIDGIRHSTVGLLSNEQFVLATQLDQQKWQDLVKDLRDRVEDETARFRLVYLIDDFVGTGTSFHRWNEDKSKWSGKLQRFKESLESAVKLIGEHVCAPGWVLCIHHYIATDAGAKAMEDRVNGALEHLQTNGWAKEIRFTYGSKLPAELPIYTTQRFADFIALTNKYYDPAIETKHTAIGGVPHIGLGYGGCALPVVLDHNTPNNSVALLWAETEGGERDGEKAPAMRPLFRRRQRHS
ncbi:phosphoribosyltransferase-like protein [Phyllobacterium chamaecytisi]|uniref:phosphoribosyltransferase-like protein n=1 Tax=Phyllobacterium chamaecytisi TaxID=2876082 RepID=UPI001CCFEE65|nr:hypothetical protein [Phyllobacterium sp. KW56]MBZ9603307.1 hypothetical protein [Phyllobacterium sp. KW56]